VKVERREFLRLAGATVVAGSLAQAGMADGPEGGTHQMADKFELPPLPYAYDALEPHYDKETVQLHHDKHHAAYVTGLNAAVEQVGKMTKSGDFAGAKAAAKAMAFHGSGHLLHSILWTNMKPGGGGEPIGELADAIKKSFGSFDAFKGLFLATANAVEGSGWGVLVRCPETGMIGVLQAEKHENLAVWGKIPILVVDVWEHAYYLKYQNKRPEWTKAFMDHLVNWDDVAARYAAVRK
jgi:Fe-Mn family superoxide dismutase